MMKHSSTAKYIKMGMIPLLLGVLYFVIPAKRSVPESDSTVVPTRSVRSVTNPKSDPNGLVTKVVWPTISLSELEGTDPFDRRMLFPDMASKDTPSDAGTAGQQVLVRAGASQDNQTSHIVQAVFQSPTGIAALVGDRVIHVGDQLADGTLVLGITAEHLILAPATNDSPH